MLPAFSAGVRVLGLGGAGFSTEGIDLKLLSLIGREDLGLCGIGLTIRVPSYK